MSRKHFSEEQMLYALKMAGNGKPVQDVCRELEVTEQSSFTIKKRNNGRAGMRFVISLMVIMLLLSGCDSVTEPEEGGGGGGGGGGPSTDRYIKLLEADITVMNSQTSQPVGGAGVTVSTGSTSCSGYTNSSGLASLSKEVSIKINEFTVGVYVDINVSAPSFSSVTIEDFLVDLTFLESGSGWAHYGAIFSHTVNITPDSGALLYISGEALTR